MLKKISDFIYRLTGIFISLDLATIVVLAFAQVVSRYVFSFSISWAQELVTYLLVYLVFLGCSMGLRDGEVAALTIVVDKMNEKQQKIIKIVVQILLIVFCVYGIIANQEVMMNMWSKKSSILRLNLGYVSIAFTLSSGIIIFNSIIAIIDLAKDILKKNIEQGENKL